MDPMQLPEEFNTQMQILLGDRFEAFKSGMMKPPVVSIKVNQRKLHSLSDLDYEDLEQIPWCESGYYLPQRPLFTANPLLHAGVFYVQDASSMIYEEAMKRIISLAYGSGDTLRVLDMCAAPGGKTTSLINALPDGSIIVANDIVANRAQILRENLIKWGYPHFIATNSNPSKFAETPELFDIVAVDAPCSGEGMMRKDEEAVRQWTPGLQKQCAELQREILTNAFKALKPGGFIIYSTCTFNTLENEKNVEYIVSELGCSPVSLNFPEEWGIGKGIETEYPCYRFMPHLTRGEGLFLAIFRKEGESPKSENIPDSKFAALIHRNTKVIADGIPSVSCKGKLEIPASESVLSTEYSKHTYPYVDANEVQALAFLRHEALHLDNQIPKGFVVVGYRGYPLGLVKNIGSRANNLYPSHWKIRMNL